MLGGPAGLCLYGRDLDEWKEEATAFKSLANSALKYLCSGLVSKESVCVRGLQWLKYR